MISTLCAFVVGGVVALYFDHRVIFGPEYTRRYALKVSVSDFFGNLWKVVRRRHY